MVVNEHPFNPVVEELGVITFLTWKQKMLMSGSKVLGSMLFKNVYNLLHRL